MPILLKAVNADLYELRALTWANSSAHPCMFSDPLSAIQNWWALAYRYGIGRLGLRFLGCKRSWGPMNPTLGTLGCCKIDTKWLVDVFESSRSAMGPLRRMS
uniref:Uncharacterized protein n=1 Tax=Cannabis sativa TaxID=3483 RepID=A0A803QG30_CANSA